MTIEMQDMGLEAKRTELANFIGHKLKFEFTQESEESPVTARLEGIAQDGKIGMILNGREKEGVLIEDLARVHDQGAVKGQTAEGDKPAKSGGQKQGGEKKAPAKKSSDGTSKKEQAAKLLADFGPSDRKAGIQKLMDELDMTKAGASTYFYNIVTKPAKQ